MVDNNSRKRRNLSLKFTQWHRNVYNQPETAGGRVDSLSNSRTQKDSRSRTRISMPDARPDRKSRLNAVKKKVMTPQSTGNPGEERGTNATFNMARRRISKYNQVHTFPSTYDVYEGSRSVIGGKQVLEPVGDAPVFWGVVPRIVLPCALLSRDGRKGSRKTKYDTKFSSLKVIEQTTG